MVRKGWSPPKNLFPDSKKFKLEQTRKGLKITEAWLVWMTPFLIISLVHLFPFLILFMSLYDSSNLAYLTILIGLVLLVAYIVLAAFLNETVVSISPEEIEITAGPLPWLGPQTWQLKSGTIYQIKVVNKLFGHKLQAIYGKKGRSVTLLRMLGQTAAFYLEEEINDYLGLPLPPEPIPLSKEYKKEEWADVYQFAEHHQLDLRISRFSAAPVLSGLYEGCQLKINFSKTDIAKPSLVTRLRLSVVQREVLPLPALDQDHTSLQVAQILDGFVAMASTLNSSGILQIEPGGQHLFYEEPHSWIEATPLHTLCETLAQILRSYPRLANLGGLAVPRLKALTAQEHALKSVALQLLHDIAMETQNRLAEEANTLICPSCLRHCAAHEIKLSLFDQFSYYGCRDCGQSLEFLPVEKAVIAILDTEMTRKYILRDEVLYGNWLLHRQGFDFDEVYLRRASDEEVERFAVQVGNDTDPLQQPRYATMRCLVWVDADLSENSLKILKRTFGRVEIKRQDVQKQPEKPKTSGSQAASLGSETEEGMAEDAQEL